MRIGIDCRAIGNPDAREGAGVSQYIFGLVRACCATPMHHEFVLFFHASFPRDVAAGMGKGSAVRRVFFPRDADRGVRRFFENHYGIAKVMQDAKLDLAHIPAGAMPLALRVPTVVTVHDLLIYEHPEWFPRQPLSVHITYPRTLRRARHCFAVSDATKNHLVRRFAIPENRVTVTHPGISFADRARNAGEGNARGDALGETQRENGAGEKPYLLFLGTLEPRKNIAVLLEAYERAWRASQLVRGTELCIAGALGWHTEPIQRAFDRVHRATSGAVRLVGYVSEHEKAMLLRAARLFVFPSLGEGFGLPVLEALAYGIPTIVSDLPVFHEVAGDAALYVDPKNREQLAAAMVQVLTDQALSRRLAALGKPRASLFSWEQTARGTLAVYERAGLPMPA